MKKQLICPRCKQKITGAAFEVRNGKLRMICPTCDYKRENRSFPEDVALTPEIADAFRIPGMTRYNAPQDRLDVPRRYRTGQHTYDDVYRPLVAPDGERPREGEEQFIPAPANPSTARENIYRGEFGSVTGTRFIQSDGLDASPASRREPRMTSRPSQETLEQWGASIRNTVSGVMVVLPVRYFTLLTYQRDLFDFRLDEAAILRTQLRSELNATHSELGRALRRIRSLEAEHGVNPTTGSVLATENAARAIDDEVRDTFVFGTNAYGATRPTENGEGGSGAGGSTLVIDDMLRAVETLRNDRPEVPETAFTRRNRQAIDAMRQRETTTEEPNNA